MEIEAAAQIEDDAENGIEGRHLRPEEADHQRCSQQSRHQDQSGEPQREAMAGQRIHRLLRNGELLLIRRRRGGVPQQFVQGDPVELSQGDEIIGIRRGLGPLPLGHRLPAEAQLFGQPLLGIAVLFPQLYQPVCSFDIHSNRPSFPADPEPSAPADWL